MRHFRSFKALLHHASRFHEAAGSGTLFVRAILNDQKTLPQSLAIGESQPYLEQIEFRLNAFCFVPPQASRQMTSSPEHRSARRRMLRAPN
jgi:hypothetical protein